MDQRNAGRKHLLGTPGGSFYGVSMQHYTWPKVIFASSCSAVAWSSETLISLFHSFNLLRFHDSLFNSAAVALVEDVLAAT